MRIKLLPADVIEKIAAGEVVERPASAVKELVENSIDAGSSRIEVEFAGGGMNLIEVSDNGSGMTPEEMLLSVKRHATSKITSFEDLQKVSTMGFRGEALPSIAAVSRMTVTSRAAGSSGANSLKMEGPGEGDLIPAARAAGTSVRVEDLFFNVPARRKFLKTPETERRQIIGFLEETALVRPDISIKAVSSGKTVFDFPPSSLKERFLSVSGKKLYDSLIELSFENPYIKLSGLATVPQESFANKSKIHVYVNSRPVTSPLVLHAVMEAYRPFLPPGRFPAAALNIGIDPSLVDVNVHPSKREVRFINQQGVHQIIAKVLKSRLGESPAHFNFSRGAVSENPVSGARKDAWRHHSRLPQPDFGGVDLAEVTKFTFSGFREENVSSPAPVPVGGIAPRFQWNNRYVVGEDPEGIVLIDQHTAWERINYEMLRRQFSQGRVVSQGLLIPEVIEPGPSRSELLGRNLELFTDFGLEVEEFGPGMFRIISAPASASGEGARRLTEDILALLEENPAPPDPAELNDEIIKVIACRSSIMSGDRMAPEQMTQMVKLLAECSVPHRCPHGRPVVVRLSSGEIDSMFGR